MGETVIGSLVPEWADLDPNTLSQPVKSLEVRTERSIQNLAVKKKKKKS